MRSAKKVISREVIWSAHLVKISREVIWSANILENRGFDREAQDKFLCALQYTEGYFL